MNGHSVRQLILTYLPTFAWQTAAEVLSMLEYVDENISEDAIGLQLTKLYQQGLLTRKIVRKPAGNRGIQEVFAYCLK
jgi:hypothetical protein